jgi:hypothetical protein
MMDDEAGGRLQATYGDNYKREQKEPASKNAP